MELDATEIGMTVSELTTVTSDGIFSRVVHRWLDRQGEKLTEWPRADDSQLSFQPGGIVLAARNTMRR